MRVGAALFTDLVGFTEFNAAAGDEAALGAVNDQSALVSGVLAERGSGRVVKELGDGLFVWFDSALDGLRASVEILDAYDRARRGHGFPLAVRMGLHHGEALPRGDDLVGQTINVASRVTDLAGPGELLVSGEVVAACASPPQGIALEPVGPVSVKGVPDPVWLHRVAR